MSASGPPDSALDWLTRHAQLRIPRARFSCLEGCGFCCTYPPQVTDAQWHAISGATGLKQVGVDQQGDLRLPLQGGCGGCVLLEDRSCTAYALRPTHCRLFPFHVYFGRTVEVYGNRVCPGLDGDGPDEATWTEDQELARSIGVASSTVDPGELDGRAAEALDVHARFEANAREAGVWADPDLARERALAAPRITGDAWEQALAAFRSERPEVLPTMVLPEPTFEWRTWRLVDDGDDSDDGDRDVGGVGGVGRFEQLRYEEDGALTHVGYVEVPVRAPLPEGPDDPAPSQLARGVLRRLASYECFVGQAMDLVDAADYELDLGRAFDQLAAEVAAALALRAHLLAAEGLPVDAHWLGAIYEPDLYDLPTIGGWL